MFSRSVTRKSFGGYDETSTEKTPLVQDVDRSKTTSMGQALLALLKAFVGTGNPLHLYKKIMII